MKADKLEQIKTKTTDIYNSLKKEKELKENKKEIQEYLENLKKLQKEEKYKTFLNELEIGEDGTVFEKYEEIINKSMSKYHYGLIEVLRHIEYLKYLNFKENNNDISLDEYNEKFKKNTEISFDELTLYAKHAEKVLNNMNYYEGDKIAENEYGIEIYENPKKYSVIDINKLIKLSSPVLQILTNEELMYNYKINEFKIELDYIFKVKQEKSITSINTDKLTPREFEAFYGVDAQNILNLNPVKLNKNLEKDHQKTKTNVLN